MLGNHVKHAAQVGKVGIAVDPFSSAEPAAATGPPLLAAPNTWLLRVGAQQP